MPSSSLAAAAVVTLAGALLCVPPAQAARGAVVHAQSDAALADECRALANINAARAEHGLPALVGLQADLTDHARSHARAMAAQGRIWHDPPALRAALPAGWTAHGENVGTSPHGVDAVHEAYMDSPRHRANILDEDFTTVGIGVWHDSRGRVFTAEGFGGTRAHEPVLSCS